MQHFLEGGERRVQIGVVGNAYRDVQLPDSAVVMQDFADDLAIRNHHFGHVRVIQRGLEHADGFHGALDPGNGDVFADAERACKYDRQAGDDVAQYALHRQCNPRARDPDPRDERQQLHPEILQRHDGEHAQNQDFYDSDDQVAHM